MKVIDNNNRNEAHEVRILFVGCGTGLEAFHVKNKTKWDVVALDIDIDIIRVSLRKEINTILGDALNLPFKDNAFDICYCSHVLEHVLSHRLVLKEIRRVIKISGKLFISVPNKERLIGYMGSNEGLSLTTVLNWNIQDYKARIQKKFSNLEGAHAGFNYKELLQELENYFDIVSHLSPQYLREISKNTKYDIFAQLIIKCRLTYMFSPSLVFLVHGQFSNYNQIICMIKYENK